VSTASALAQRVRAKASASTKSKYDLRASQVPTPLPVVRFFWDTVRLHRPSLGSVLDMGAGDGRFSRFGHFKSYIGYEIDATRIGVPRPRANARLLKGCVFASKLATFDACVGNPPYLRHHDIESPWKEKTLRRLAKDLRGLTQDLSVDLSGHGNLFLYFLALGILRSRTDGLVALVVPFDWVSRPSALSIRELIRAKKWNVSVYRFSFSVFDDVNTTASVSIIDKSAKEGKWSYFDVSPTFEVVPRRGVTGSGLTLLEYTKRGSLYARRGLAPGNQRVFTLTEGERIHHGLRSDDVEPCVTTLRGVDRQLEVLNAATFREHFIDAGRRCWLVKSRGELSERVREYLDGVSVADRSTSTCLRQQPWYRYEQVDQPELLLHSGFTSEGPKILVNAVRAIPVGAVYGIYGCPKGREPILRSKFASKRVVQRIVPHSGRLRKLEIGQVNELLSELGGELSV
jgi:hypothetical protein